MTAPTSLAGVAFATDAGRRGTAWLFSWPLLSAAFAYLYAIFRADKLLLDGDTFWHIAAGRWIFEHLHVPSTDPFSHSRAGAPWMAHEWLSEILLAAAHEAGGWHLVVAVTGAAFALSIALLTRALLRYVEPVYAVLFAGFAVALTSGHLLARPHILALPLLLAWTIEMVRSAEENRTPSLWLLPGMVIWANLHGGFTLGIALAGAAALEAFLHAAAARRVPVVLAWARFILLATAASLLTPHGIGGIAFTWDILVGSPYALERIGEWRSPDFQQFNAFELWLLGGLALVLYQGLRLPLLRLAVMLGLLHLALKHARYVELVGLLVPLYIAGPFGAQWQARVAPRGNADKLDRFFRKLAQPAGAGALLVTGLVLAGGTALLARTSAIELPRHIAPHAAIDAALKAGVTGRVLNGYGLGGYLIYRGIPVFIDGRSDVYGDAFLKEFVKAMEVRDSRALPDLIERYGIGWSVLEAENSAAAVLERMEGWKRVYGDESVVVHMRVAGPAPAAKQ